MSAPVQTQSQQQQQATSTPSNTSNQSTTQVTGPPPVPPTKPVLSSPGTIFLFSRHYFTHIFQPLLFDNF